MRPSSVFFRAPAAVRRRLQVSLLTVIPIAVLSALASGFIVISLQGAVGAAERVGDPFRRWLTISAAVVPVHVLAVLAAVALARWWFADSRFRRLLYASTLVTMIAATSIVGVAEVAGSAAYDYRFQSARIERTAAQTAGLVGESAAEASSPGTYTISVCTTCESRRRTLATHVRGGTVASIVTLIANAVIVLWVVAFRGGQLWIGGSRRTAPSSSGTSDRQLAVT